MTEKTMKEKIQLYLAKAEEINFTPANIKTVKGKREAIRYLLVNGLIPVNAENLGLVGKIQFFVSAEHVPDDLKKKVLKSAMPLEDDWDYDEESVDKELKVISTKVEGVWIKNGSVQEAKLARQREVRVTTILNTPELKIKIP